MKRKLPKLLSACAAVSAIVILSLSSAALLRPFFSKAPAVAVFSQNEGISYASFSPTVLDGRTKQPVEGATIVIPEENLTQKTDARGKTEIRIPYRIPLSSTLPKDWQEITLLVYGDGYAPYALFYLQLRESALRQGPTILLFPDGEKPFSIIESPPEDWVEDLVEQYRP